MPGGSVLRFTGVRAAQDRYLSDLRSIYGTGIQIPDPDYAILSDPEIYDKIERDPVIYTALDMRLKSVIGQTWHCEAPSDSKIDKGAAAVMEEILAGIKNFQQSRLLFFRSALLMARGYAWMRGSRPRVAKLDGRVVRNPYLPSKIQLDDKRRFQFVPHRDPVGGESNRYAISQELQYYDISIQDWVTLKLAHLRSLMVMTYNDRADRLGMGQGLGVPLYHWFRQKALAWRDWAQAGERWALGVVAMKVNQDRESSMTNEELADEAMDQIDAMRSRHALVYGEGEEVQVFETSGSGMQISADQIERIDQDIIRLLTGSVRPMGGDTGSSGARAQSETEQDTTDVIVAYDRSQLDESMTETLVKSLWELNRSTFTSLGLGNAGMPRFATSPEKRSDPAVSVSVISQALASQIPLRKTDVYEALGFQAPAEGDAVFEGQAPQPPGGGGFPNPFSFAADFAEQSRGQPGNSGQWGPGGAGGKKDETKDGGKKEATPKTPESAAITPKDIVSGLSKAKWPRFGDNKPPTKDPKDAVPSNATDRELEVLYYMAKRNALGTGVKNHPKGKKAQAALIAYWGAVMIQIASQHSPTEEEGK